MMQCSNVDGLVAAVVQRDLHRVRVDERAPPVELGDLVLLHQEVDALDPAVGDLAAALEGGAVVERDVAATMPNVSRLVR